MPTKSGNVSRGDIDNLLTRPPKKQPTGDISKRAPFGFWLELALVIALCVLFRYHWWSVIPLVLVIGLPPVRRFMWNLLVAASWRRRWNRACRAVGIENPPRIGFRVRRRPVGFKVSVSLTSDCPASVIEKNAERLATYLKLREVRIQRGKTQDKATLVLVQRDPFDDLIKKPDGQLMIRPLPWPDRQATELSMWEPIKLGINEDGETVSVNLVESNLLIGGVPGSGKSAAESILVAVGALDPHARLWLMDGKGVDLPIWRPCAYRYSGPNRKDAIKVLTELRDEVQRRYEMLTEMSLKTGRPVRKIKREMGLPLHVLVCDELAVYLLADDKPGKADADKILDLLRQIASLGRAAGVICGLATQRPDAQTVDTRLRTLLTYRLALACSDWQSSDTITAGLASSGIDASKIPDEQKGVGWLCAETGRPVLTRCFYLDDDDLYDIASRAVGNAAERELLVGQPHPVGD